MTLLHFNKYSGTSTESLYIFLKNATTVIDQNAATLKSGKSPTGASS